jgi:hypothetical protein
VASAGRIVNSAWGARIFRIDRSTLDTVYSATIADPTYSLLNLTTFIRLEPNRILMPVLKDINDKPYSYLYVIDSLFNVKKEIPLSSGTFGVENGFYDPVTKRIILGGMYTQKPGEIGSWNVSMVSCDTLGVITNAYASPITYTLFGNAYYSPFDSTYVCVGSQRTYFYQGYSRERINISKYDRDFNLLWRKSYGEELRYCGFFDT